jgi:hypothetical protein
MLKNTKEVTMPKRFIMVESKDPHVDPKITKSQEFGHLDFHQTTYILLPQMCHSKSVSSTSSNTTPITSSSSDCTRRKPHLK